VEQEEEEIEEEDTVSGDRVDAGVITVSNGNLDPVEILCLYCTKLYIQIYN